MDLLFSLQRERSTVIATWRSPDKCTGKMSFNLNLISLGFFAPEGAIAGRPHFAGFTAVW